MRKYDVSKIDGGAHDYHFKIFLKKDDDNYLSLLKAGKGGQCESVATLEEFRRCGFATQLMLLCFQDRDITANGGVDISTDEQFEKNPVQKQQAIDECQTIVTLTMGGNIAAGISYIKAAIQAKYQKMFTVTAGETNMGSMKTDDAVKEFKQLGSDKFVFKYGMNWFFCKCKNTGRCTIS